MDGKELLFARMNERRQCLGRLSGLFYWNVRCDFLLRRTRGESKFGLFFIVY